MRCLAAVLLGMLLAVPIGANAASPGNTNQKAVLVTGASTGIGKKITERLAAKGYFVYAGARKEADIKALNTIHNVQAVRLDVTRPAEIAAAADTIRKAGRGLYGLVNNAGIGTIQPVLGGSEAEFDLAMAVNVEGPYRVTRAFAPLIVEQKGRITNIGSISGIIAVRNAAAYCMTKHAMEAFTDSLASEMSSLGVLVNIIEPGAYRSEISKNALARSSKDMHSPDRSMLPEPDDVAAAVEDALFSPTPKRRYLVVPTEVEAEVVIRRELEKLAQLNEGQRYTYDRTALIKMLDESLQGARPRTK